MALQTTCGHRVPAGLIGEPVEAVEGQADSGDAVQGEVAEDGDADVPGVHSHLRHGLGDAQRVVTGAEALQRARQVGRARVGGKARLHAARGQVRDGGAVPRPAARRVVGGAMRRERVPLGAQQADLRGQDGDEPLAGDEAGVTQRQRQVRLAPLQLAQLEERVALVRHLPGGARRTRSAGGGRRGSRGCGAAGPALLGGAGGPRGSAGRRATRPSR